MSTRATIHFQYLLAVTPHYSEWKTEAIVYRHGDGYPEGLGKDIQTFFNEVATLAGTIGGTRFGDPAYLAAKWVVWDATRRQVALKEMGGIASPLNFLSVGVVMKDPGDIEYRYLVRCTSNRARPHVICEKV